MSWVVQSPWRMSSQPVNIGTVTADHQVLLNWGGQIPLTTLVSTANQFWDTRANIYGQTPGTQLSMISSAIGAPLTWHRAPTPIEAGVFEVARRAPAVAEIAGGAATSVASAASTLALNPIGPFGIFAGGAAISDGIVNYLGLTRTEPSLFDAFSISQGASPAQARQLQLAAGMAGSFGRPGYNRPCPNAPAANPSITRGTVDIGSLRHYNWRAPTGQTFDLLLRAEVSGGRLVIRDAHIMPQSGTFAQSQNTLGLSGLRQLQRDLGAQFGVDTIEITNRIGRPTGQAGGFGPGVFPVR